METDLFGNQYKPKTEKPKPLSKYQLFREENNYADGTKYQCCKVCEYCRRMEYHNKYYYKCIKLGMSKSEATDVRASKVCDLFREE